MLLCTDLTSLYQGPFFPVCRNLSLLKYMYKLFIFPTALHLCSFSFSPPAKKGLILLIPIFEQKILSFPVQRGTLSTVGLFTFHIL